MSGKGARGQHHLKLIDEVAEIYGEVLERKEAGVNARRANESLAAHKRRLRAQRKAARFVYRGPKPEPVDER